MTEQETRNKPGKSQAHPLPFNQEAILCDFPI